MLGKSTCIQRTMSATLNDDRAVKYLEKHPL